MRLGQLPQYRVEVTGTNEERRPRLVAKTPEIVAAVDLGSNSFHMLVAKLDDGQLHTIDRLKEPIRLAAGLDDHRNLSIDAQQRALDCLERFGQRLRDMPDESIRAVGTNTLRKAQNSSVFLYQAIRALGHPIDVVSGIEEARLIYLGVAQNLASDDTRRLVMDIGGGSTEFIIGTGTTPLQKESLHMGCVSMSYRHFANGKISAKRMKRAVLAAHQEIEIIGQTFSRRAWQSAVGASGTLRAVGKVIEGCGWSKEGITLDGLDRLVRTLIEAEHVSQLQLDDLSTDRLDVFPGGVAIIYAAFKSLGIENMQVSDGALREGLLYDLVGRIFHHDIRDKSVRALAERYHINSDHSKRIIQTLRFCLKQVSLPTTLNQTTALKWLSWAAELHEIGLDIAHSQYHKHGAYIIEHADLAGFSRQDQKLLAGLVRIHRRKFINKLFDNLGEPWQSAAQSLAILLRLSVLLHRSQQPEPLPQFDLIMNKKYLQIRFPARWLKHHRLTLADLEQEAAYLGACEIEFDFE